MLRKLWSDDAGIVAMEYLFMATIIALGLAVGATAVSDSLNAELTELGDALLALNQSYYINGQGVWGLQGGLSDYGQKNGTNAVDVGPGTSNFEHTVGDFVPSVTTSNFAQTP
jgi:Flp pilus assembly pilin Flp